MPSDTPHANNLCGSCGKVATKSCTRCRRTGYCDVDCQRKDWKEHKKICIPSGSMCTRCQEIVSDSNLRTCTVPHPVHMLQDCGSSYGGVCTASFACQACGQSFTRSTRDYKKLSEAPITGGAEFCFHGYHTIKPLDNNDERRVCHDVLVLTAGPNLQNEINKIPQTMPDVRILTIQSPGCFDDSISFVLDISMPKLEILKFIDVNMQKVKLDTKLTPLVRELFMQNIPDECDLTVLLPQLKSFTMHYYGPPDCDKWIHEMLSAATKLETFDSYKLRVGPELFFASSELRSIRLHRAELLVSLSIYAPKLRELNLQACYGLDGELTVLDTHPRFEAALNQSQFNVNTTNACISPSIASTLRNNPRAIWDGEEEEDDFGGGFGNPMEAMFANMHSGMR